MLEGFAGRRVTVMGLGRFGGGLGAARWLATQGARVLVTDTATAETLAEPVAALRDLVDRGVVRLHLGGHAVSDFTACDLVVANPAVPRPWSSPELMAAQAAGVPVTTEIRLVVERLERHRTIGITGTAGKSTTAAMIHHVLTRAGFATHLGGNIGGSLLSRLDAIGSGDWVVLELSSAMLHWLGSGVGAPEAPAFSPHVALLTNLEENHLDWHGTFDHYARSKQNIFAAQTAGDHQVRGDEIAVDTPPVPLRIPGVHNQRNAVTALAAVACVTGLDRVATHALLADFPGLPHRLELVAERHDRRFYNDSKSTTPGATVRAVGAFASPDRVHLIAGGYDKGIDLAPIAQLAPGLAGLYAIGATGSGLAAASRTSGVAHDCGTLAQAVPAALARMNAGDVLLLSPGCASWDQFVNYEARGDAFRRLVTDASSAASPSPPRRAGVH